ncbi:glycosyltransferase family 2 protein [candidate division KSB1 bacterium]|nr:glycosyltransferase family 2 protein [candidate division KSB1 bacterium]
MAESPLVSIVIPHYRGKEILYQCLTALERTSYPNTQVILVDNASSDGSVVSVSRDFPWVKVVANKVNAGYAGGCNSGLRLARGEFVLFLNDDTVFEPDWLNPLAAALIEDVSIAACQPKLLALHQRDTFDYSGAAGGLMDVFGFPFALGRIFFTLEKDEKQYDTGGEIFWASGTAILVRKSTLERVGIFDEDFFAHMEEIDLSWRFHLAGMRVVVVPQSEIFHNSGSTLTPDSFKKVYLNHRNSLVMLLKNYELNNVLWIVPVRVILELVAILYSVLKLDFVRVRAVLLAFVSVLFGLPKTLRKRADVQKTRRVSDAAIFSKMYRGSIVVDYFVRNIKRAQDLPGLHRSEFKR